MIRILTCAAALWLAAISNTSAQIVLFSGGGYVHVATEPCANEGISVSSFMLATYLPAGLGSNGPRARLTYTSLPQSVSQHTTFIRMPGALTTTLEIADATTITPLAVTTYTPRVRATSIQPPNVTPDSPHVNLNVVIRGANGNPNCNFILHLGVINRSG
jgi:hypothetical protein